MSVASVQRNYILSDLLSSSVAWLLFNLLRYYLTGTYSRGSTFATYFDQQAVWTGQILMPLFMLFIFYLSGYYATVRYNASAYIFGNTLVSTVAIEVILSFALLLNDWNLFPSSNYTVLWLMFLALFLPIYLSRRAVAYYTDRRVSNRTLAYRTLIVGEQSELERLSHKLRTYPKGLGYNVVAQLPLTQKSTIREDKLQQLITESGATTLLVSVKSWHMRQQEELLNTLSTHCYLPIVVSVKRSYIISAKPPIQFERYSIDKTSYPERCLKRTFDIATATLALLLFSPIMLLIAIAIKYSVGGAIFYKQERLGYHKQPFMLYKIRSMYEDAEADTPQLSSENDPRITPLGRFLRKYRLDEVPQFWNVIKGDMSMVGPRPERAYYAAQLASREPSYNHIYHFRPGITSWGMVKYGYARDVEQMLERFEYDKVYLHSASLLIDFKIIVYTIRTVITGKGI